MIKVFSSYFSRQLFLILFLTAFIGVTGAQPPTQPILRIEGGMHNGSVKRISIDRENRFLVTGGYDKTARVWDLLSGQMTQILRPPIGEGHEGKIYTVAISPDGNTVAVGGWTGFSWEKKSSIYLFDRESGQMIKRVGNLTGLVHYLSYSPDGKFLAAGFDSRGSVRIFETNEYQTVGLDLNNSQDIIESLAFHPNSNRLVTGDKSGVLRLYDIEPAGTLRRVATNQIKEGKMIFNVHFSPDGERIAAGFDRLKYAAVFSAKDLSFSFVPDPKEINFGDFLSVAWSANGQRLYGGGSPYDTNKGSVIRIWKNEGRGSYKETSVSTNTIFQILPLQNGGLAYCAGSDWGILDEDGRQVKKYEASIADYRGDGKGIYISDSGNEVSFQYVTNEKFPARFSLYDRKLELGDNKKGLKPPVIKADGLDITGWEGTTEPKLNGQIIGFYYKEMSHSMAITPDEKSFLIGMSNHLRLIDREGKEIWRKQMPESVWSVNASKDGKFAVAAIGDGTIRWYRISDGQELLAFFPHSDQKRWILWTPSGYYDASPDAEDLIGWHVNNTVDKAADFFPNHLFRAQFYRPDVIDQVLRTGDEMSAFRISNEKAGRKDQYLSIAQILPPVIEIHGQNVETVTDETVNVKYSIRNHSGEKVTGVKALIDGREIDTTESKPIPQNGTAEITIRMPRRGSELTLIAENRFTRSLPVKIRLK